MAISSYKVFLMKGTGSGDSYTKLLDIKDFPDLGGEPEMLETTTLSHKMQTYIDGIQKLDALKFSCNYTKEDYATVKALGGVEGDYAVWFGGSESGGTLTPTGEHGKFSFKGIPSVYVNGAGVNEVIGMTVTIAPTTEITDGTTSS